MTRVFNISKVSFCGFFLVVSSVPLFSQQSNIQTSFLSPVAVHLPSAGVLADIAETVHLPYINQVAKDNHKTVSSFRPTASDMLIDQAEEQHLLGRRAFLDQDFARARKAFDSAIDLMLRASENPTSRPLYESKMEEMVDSIHRFDLSGMGASVPATDPQFDKAPLDDIVQM